MYRSDYHSGSGGVSPMVFDARVYIAAEKYSVAALTRYAKKKLENNMQACWNINNFSQVIKEAYTSNSTPFDLRELLANVALQHIGDLLQNNNFQQVLGNVTGFAADIIQLLAPEQTSAVKYCCPYCDNH
jgi:hypothetical protein